MIFIVDDMLFLKNKQIEMIFNEIEKLLDLLLPVMIGRWIHHCQLHTSSGNIQGIGYALRHRPGYASA